MHLCAVIIVRPVDAKSEAEEKAGYRNNGSLSKCKYDIETRKGVHTKRKEEDRGGDKATRGIRENALKKNLKKINVKKYKNFLRFFIVLFLYIHFLRSYVYIFRSNIGPKRLEEAELGRKKLLF